MKTSKNKGSVLLKNDRPPAPDDLPPRAAEIWVQICAGQDPEYFGSGDLQVLRELCIVLHQKRQIDASIERSGVLAGVDPHPGLKVSATLANVASALSGKLRIVRSATTRPDASSLAQGHRVAARAWQDDPLSEFFDAPKATQ
jgi:hypothetical protein